MASLNLGWRASGDRGGADLTVRYNGETLDNDFSTFPATSRTLPAFTLVNIAGHWNVAERLQVFGRVENLTDEAYQEVFNYDSVGRAAYVGVRARY
jgi:vitamin B12 transporter